MNKAIIAVLLMAAFNANASKNNEGCQGNCPTTGGSPTSSESSAVGLGLGVGIGGDSSASVGDIKNTASGGSAAVVGSGNSHNLNSNKAEGGTGIGFGGSAHQGQQQGQAQQQAQSTDARSQNDNRSNASGNATSVNVGGDVYEAKRNAPGIVGGSVFPTATCKAGFGIGGSGPAGGGLLNIATTDRECQVIVLAQNFDAYGERETACKLLLTTKTWARAIKKNPALAEIACKAKPAPVAVPHAELAPRTPRG